MKLPQPSIRLVGLGAILLIAFFFGTAFVGWQREKHDVRVKRAQFREQEAAIRSAIEEVGEGVPIQTFRKLLPNAWWDEESKEWVVFIPTGYDETPAYTNIHEKIAYFRMDGSIVRPVEFKTGGGGLHCDRFGPGGVLYYFGRAWYSTVDH